VASREQVCRARRCGDFEYLMAYSVSLKGRLCDGIRSCRGRATVADEGGAHVARRSMADRACPRRAPQQPGTNGFAPSPLISERTGLAPSIGRDIDNRARLKTATLPVAAFSLATSARVDSECLPMAGTGPRDRGPHVLIASRATPSPGPKAVLIERRCGAGDRAEWDLSAPHPGYSNAGRDLAALIAER
jgi:hypothetical protein